MMLFIGDERFLINPFLLQLEGGEGSGGGGQAAPGNDQDDDRDRRRNLPVARRS